MHHAIAEGPKSMSTDHVSTIGGQLRWMLASFLPLLVPDLQLNVFIAIFWNNLFAKMRLIFPSVLTLICVQTVVALRCIENKKLIFLVVGILTHLCISSLQEGFAFAHCTECRAVFILRANVPPDRWWLRLKFQLLVARDHAFIFVIVQLVC